MSTDVAAGERSPAPFRIGSFISRDVTEPGDARAPIQVVGVDESPFAGRSAIAHQATIENSTNTIIGTEVKLAKLRHLTHPALLPVLECGLEGTVAFWIHGEPVGKPLSQASASDPSWSSVTGVRTLIDTIGGVLQIAHDVGLSHGAINAETIVINPAGKPILTGFGIDGQGFARDQADLSLVAIELLGGRAWVEPAVPIDDVAGHDLARAQQVRDFLDTCTERVTTVLAKATDPDPADRYPSIAEFVKAFDEAVRFSADELVDAAFQAMATTPEMARLIADKAATYDPGNDNLKLLNLQLNGGSHFATAAGAGFPNPAGIASADPLRVPMPVLEQNPAQRSLLPPELTEGLPPEFLETIASQFTVKPVKKGMHPLFILMMGAAGVILLLAIAGVATVVLGGS
jgi:hypothetical protein